MTDLGHLSDRMPEVASMRDEWSEVEQAHLQHCAECRSEWALVQATSALGAGFRYEPDPDAIADAVRRRLRETPAASAARGSHWWAAGLAAASIALFVWGGRAHQPVGSSSTAQRVGGEVQSAFAMPELDSLGTGELTAVLDSFDGPLSGRSTVGAQGLGDLTDQELERVLRAGGV
jgi:hypothetical protein